jgi:hypothetical protein
MDDRRKVELAFLSGAIKLICCTSVSYDLSTIASRVDRGPRCSSGACSASQTLAVGVNLRELGRLSDRYLPPWLNITGFTHYQLLTRCVDSFDQLAVIVSDPSFLAGARSLSSFVPTLVSLLARLVPISEPTFLFFASHRELRCGRARA